MKPTYKSKVYTDRPAYADFDSPHKFEAVKSIIAKRLTEYPNAICSYSGGSDSDIMLHLIETVRKTFILPPVEYCFFNTGLEMDAIKRHVRETEERYGVKIAEHRPEKNIVKATGEYGLPFISKIVSSGLEGVRKKNIPRLGQAVADVKMFPTPTVGAPLCGGTGNYEQLKQLVDSGTITEYEKRQMAQQGGGQLNPDWVEWLMGFPAGWTDISKDVPLPEYDPHWYDAEPDIPRTATGIPNRVDRLKALGNAVDPYQFYPVCECIAEVLRGGEA